VARGVPPPARIAAGVTGASMAGAMTVAGVTVERVAAGYPDGGVELRGLKSLLGRRTVTVAAYERFLHAMARAAGREAAEPTTAWRRKRKSLPTVVQPTPTIEFVVEAVRGLGLRGGECFEARDLAKRLPFDIDPGAVEVTLKAMAKRGEVVRATTWGNGQPGYAPSDSLRMSAGAFGETEV
jgi:hypothetical protein